MRDLHSVVLDDQMEQARCSKTIQYVAEADTSIVLVALDLKAAFQNVSRRAMFCSIEQNDADLAAVFSKWYTGTLSTGCTTTLPTPKSVPTAGLIRDVLSRRVGFSAASDPVLRSVLADICRQHDPGAKLFAPLDDWYLWIKPQYPLQTVALMTAATRSDKVKLTLSCLGGHLQIHLDIEPSPVVLGEQASMEKTTQRFQRIANHTCRHQC